MALESLPKIAPALFSAEQDLIQIYNKKSDTVGTINASYIGGSTPPSGVSGAIQFSDGSAFSSDSNLFWDNVNKRLGIGTNAPISKMHIAGLSTFVGASGNILGSTTANAAAQFYQTGFNGVLAIGGYSNGGGEIQTYQGGGNSATGSLFLQRQSGNVLIGSASDTAKLSIKGSGSTSATSSLLVQNSASANLLSVLDNGYVGVGTASPTAKTHIVGAGTTNTTFPFLATDSAGTLLFRISDLGHITLASNQASKQARFYISGYTTYPALNITSGSTTIATVDDGNLVMQGGSIQFYNGTNTTEWGRFFSTGNLLLQTGGTYTDAGYKLDVNGSTRVKGSGSTSATTSLLVQNSGGVAAMTIKDDLSTNLGGILNLVYNSSYISASGGANSSTTFIANTSAAWNGFAFGNSLLSYFAEIRTDRTNVYTPLFVTLVGNNSSSPPPTPNASAILQADSTTQGFLPPRMTDAQIRAIASPAEGLVAYNTTISHLCCYQSGSWVKLNHSPM